MNFKTKLQKGLLTLASGAVIAITPPSASAENLAVHIERERNSDDAWVRVKMDEDSARFLWPTLNPGEQLDVVSEKGKRLKLLADNKGVSLVTETGKRIRLPNTALRRKAQR